MIIHTVTGETQMVSLNNQPPQAMKQKLTGFKLTDDDDIVEFMDDMIQGRDIIYSSPIGAKLGESEQQGSFVVVREFIPSKIALPTPGQEPLQP